MVLFISVPVSICINMINIPEILRGAFLTKSCEILLVEALRKRSFRRQAPARSEAGPIFRPEGWAEGALGSARPPAAPAPTITS